MNPKRAGLLILAALHLAVDFFPASAENMGAVPGQLPHAMHIAAKGRTTAPVTRLGGNRGVTMETVAGDGVVSPMDFGAAGNGTADDYPALLRATDHAFANGLPIDGGDRVYGTSENRFLITGRTRPHIRRLRLKQIAP